MARSRRPPEWPDSPRGTQKGAQCPLSVMAVGSTRTIWFLFSGRKGERLVDGQRPAPPLPPLPPCKEQAQSGTFRQSGPRVLGAELWQGFCDSHVQMRPPKVTQLVVGRAAVWAQGSCRSDVEGANPGSSVRHWWFDPRPHAAIAVTQPRVPARSSFQIPHAESTQPDASSPWLTAG